MSIGRVTLAAANNVDWYAMMWEVHGLRYKRDANGFRAIDPPPAYHGWAVAMPGAEIADLIAPALDKPGFAVKDASGQHDLTGLGLAKLFDASWIWHDGNAAATATDWQRITSADALVKWEAAWSTTSPTTKPQFPPTILQRDDVRVFGRKAGDGFDAGFIANRSTGCVGLSNLFGSDAFPAATTLCAGFGNGKPLVGYERGEALTQARAAGWTTTGDLTVWARQTSP